VPVEAPSRLRIDGLAQASGVASGTIRFYQRQGLIPPPEREGRVAWYGEEHLRRLEQVKALQAQGLPLALVRDLLEREDGGEDIGGWLALDSAVFAPPRGGEPVAPGAFEGLGLAAEDVDALVAAGLLRRDAEGTVFAVPGVLELTVRLVGAGVPPATIRAGAELIARRVRALAEATAQLGWEVFAAERERIESGEPVARDVLAKLERLRGLAERMVTTLFPEILDEVVRERSEAFAVEVVERRRAE
jgi:DNA-binding transcriptional MerR regulator